MQHDQIWDGFLDIVIFPPASVRDHIVALSEGLQRHHGTPWALGLNERKPHLSLIHFPLNPDLGAADAVATLSGEIHGGDIALADISSPRDGAIFLNATVAAWLVAASEKAARVLWKNGVAREDPRFMERWQQVALTPRMLENIRKWHSPWMGEDFLPHFTLGVVSDKERAPEIAASLDFSPMKWIVDNLYVVQVGNGWTAGNILGEVPLAR